MRTQPHSGFQTPALNLWRDAIHSGKRTPTRFDALWAAACEECNAREFVRAGLPLLVQSCLRRAHQAVRAE